ncbi:MAG TPA: S1C family serine protease [Actinomycetota bacterium]
MGVLQELQSGVQAVTDNVGRSVVGIGQRWGIGSGVVIAPGKVLTNAHNIRGEQLAVTFADGRHEQGTIAGVDIDGDVAVLSVDTGDVPPISWNGTADIGLGLAVFALSNPGGRGLRVTFGLVSGTARAFRGPRGRRIAGSVEHTAPLLPGSSGGPVVDLEGRLLGINTNRLGEGFYLAIPADDALRRRVEALSEGQAPSRPKLGVGVVPPQVARGLRRAVGLPESDGLLVRHVEDDSPAARAGIAEGDMIVAVGEQAVSDADELHDALEAAGTGATIELSILRGLEQRAVTVTL